MAQHGRREADPERTPCIIPVALEGVGVLRLRNCFASRSSYFAQDDIFLG